MNNFRKNFNLTTLLKCEKLSFSEKSKYGKIVKNTQFIKKY